MAYLMLNISDFDGGILNKNSRTFDLFNTTFGFVFKFGCKSLTLNEQKI